MHRQDIEKWLQIIPHGNLDGDYHHLRLLQPSKAAWKQIVEKLIRYFEEAHADARRVFREGHATELDPLGGPEYDYPRDFPLETQKGWFGEAFCGVLASSVEIIGRKDWVIPIFLFRGHADAEDYLARLIYGERVPDAIPGRRGSDFIAICVAESGEIAGLLVGESKCHETFNLTNARTALEKLNEESAIPVSLRQMKRILREIDPVKHAKVIESIERIVLQAKSPKVPRTDLFVYIFGNPGVKDYSAPRIEEEDKTKRYTCGRKLEVAEVHIEDAEELISTVYHRLYQKAEGADGVK